MRVLILGSLGVYGPGVQGSEDVWVPDSAIPGPLPNKLVDTRSTCQGSSRTHGYFRKVDGGSSPGGPLHANIYIYIYIYIEM